MLSGSFSGFPTPAVAPHVTDTPLCYEASTIQKLLGSSRRLREGGGEGKAHAVCGGAYNLSRKHITA